MYFCFDVETGGINAKDASLLQLGYFLFSGDILYHNDFVNAVPDDGVYKVSASALKVNNIDLREHSKTAISYSQLDGVLLAILENRAPIGSKFVPMGWNVGFDLSFMKEYLPRTHSKLQYRVLDVQSLWMFYCDLHNIRNVNSLSQAYKYLFPEGNLDQLAHNALEDARMTWAIYSDLLDKLGIDKR